MQNNYIEKMSFSFSLIVFVRMKNIYITHKSKHRLQAWLGPSKHVESTKKGGRNKLPRKSC